MGVDPNDSPASFLLSGREIQPLVIRPGSAANFYLRGSVATEYGMRIDEKIAVGVADCQLDSTLD